MIRARLRAECAWFLRRLSKRLNAAANRLDPIKLRPFRVDQRAPQQSSSKAYVASKTQVDQIIERVRARAR